MSTVKHWLDGLIYGVRSIWSNGSSVAERGTVDFLPPLKATDNAGAETTEVEIDEASATAGGMVPSLVANRALLCDATPTMSWATITNTVVDAAAAIAGTKIDPDFGAQNITTTGVLSLGGTPASSGDVRLTADGEIRARNNADSVDLRLFSHWWNSGDSADTAVVGWNTAVDTMLSHGASNTCRFRFGGADKTTFDGTDWNFLTANLLTTGYLGLGSTVASAGSIRLSNTGTITFRNSGDSADISGLNCNGDVLTIGSRSTSIPTQVEIAASGSGLNLYLSGANRALFNSGGLTLYAGAQLIRFSTQVTSTAAIEMQSRTSGASVDLEVRGQDSSVNSGTAGSVTSRAGDATGTTSTGGDNVNRAGAGTSAGGTWEVQAGDGTPVARVDDDDALKVVGAGGLEVDDVHAAGEFQLDLNGEIVHYKKFSFTTSGSGLGETVETIPMANDEVANILVVGRSRGNSTGDSVTFEVRGGFEKTSGTVAGSQSLTRGPLDENAGYIPQLLATTASGGSWRFRVQDDGAETVNFNGFIRWTQG